MLKPPQILEQEQGGKAEKRGQGVVRTGDWCREVGGRLEGGKIETERSTTGQRAREKGHQKIEPGGGRHLGQGRWGEQRQLEDMGGGKNESLTQPLENTGMGGGDRKGAKVGHRYVGWPSDQSAGIGVFTCKGGDKTEGKKY